MAHFPIFVDLEGREVLVVGGGRIAARRIESLLFFGPGITVIAPAFAPELKELAVQNRIRLIRTTWQQWDKAMRPFMLLAATDCSEINEEAARWGRHAGAVVNVCHDRGQSDFYFPGIARWGNVTVGVTAGGKDHRLAARVTDSIRRELEEMVKDGTDNA